MPKRLRTRKLIKTALQLRLTLVFAGLGAIAALFQLILMNRSLAQLAEELPVDGDVLLSAMPRILATNLLLTLGVLLPVLLGVGVLVTHRIAGPVYRFEQWLGEIIAGRDPGPCRLRAGDELQELCQQLNEAVLALRAESEGAVDEDEAGHEAA
jgi:hypothetical protein